MRSAILIILSAGFAGFGALEVLALAPSAKAVSIDQLNGTHPSDLENRPSDPPDNNCLTAELAARLMPQAAALETERQALDLRQQELESLETAIEDRMATLETTHQALKAMTAELNQTAEGDISHLVEMYSTMKPKKAAEIFNRMDASFAAGFLREIDSARAGMIMAEMGAEQSYRVSLLIAGRHASWRGDGKG